MPSRIQYISFVITSLLASASAHAQEPLAPSPAPAPSSPPLPASDQAPLAGYHNGLFFLRDASDTFRLYVQGRVHVDALSWYGPGVSALGPDSALKTTLTIRRARLEIGGEFFHDWQWLLSADFGPYKTDNVAARTATSSATADPSTGALGASSQSAPVEAPLASPAAADAFVNYSPSPWLNIQAGQYLLPFGLEARIGDNTTTFLERSVVVRSLAAPFTRDIGAMVWGEAPTKHVYYSLGLYDGDGPNRPNADNRFDVVGRVFARPFVGNSTSPVRDAQVGVSGKLGSRDPKLVGYDLPVMTTEGGYAFWRPTYRDSAKRLLHILPSAQQNAIGFEMYVPIEKKLDLQGEVIYAYDQTREAVDFYQLSPFTERLGALYGYGYYVQAAYWVVGDRDVIGLPSYGRPLHADLNAKAKPAEHGLQVAARFEKLALTYQGSSRGGTLDAKTPNGDIEVDAVTLGINYWATRHLRVGLNYGFYSFPSSEPITPRAQGGPSQSQVQRALAPAQYLAAGVDDDARDNGHVLHELQARVGVQF